MRLYFCILITCFIYGCSSGKHERKIPTTVLSMDSMIKIVTEMQLIEASGAIHLIRGKDPRKIAINYYAGLFTRYKLTQSRFEESLKFYNSNPALVEEMYNRVIDELSRMQAEEGN